MPKRINNNLDKIDAKARITSMSNFNLLEGEAPVEDKTYEGLFHNMSNKTVLRNWIYNEEYRSTINKHKNVMRIISSIAKSMKNEGAETIFELI